MRRRASLAVSVTLAVVASGRRGVAAVQVETSFQESVFDQAELDSPNLTIAAGPQRVLLVVVATGNLSAATQRVTWNGEALGPFEAHSLGTPKPCRLELWVLFDPSPGTGPLVVTLSAATGFGVGAVVYSGVDREAPFGPRLWQTGSGGPVALDLPAPDVRPVLGAACLGGAWTTGPTLTTPEAITGNGEDELWNFTEPGVVGLGSHRVAMNGGARISWDVGGTEPFDWMVIGFSVKPLGEVLPDAGPDSSADAAEEDAGGDGSAERGMTDLPTGAVEEDGGADGGSVADVHLRVGCACDTGGVPPIQRAFPLVLAALIVGLRRRIPR
jgi:MYXO-CTERM domain-containing protein